MAIEVPKGISVKDFFMDFIPKTFAETTADLDISGYEGVETTTVVELKGGDEAVFTVELKNGKDLTISEGSTDGALLYVELISAAFIRYLNKDLPDVLMKEFDSLLADPSALLKSLTEVPAEDTIKKLNMLKSVDGRVGIKADVEGEIFEAYVRFNGADSPAFTVNASFADVLELMSGEVNPIQGFMSGKYKIEGDMSLAMKLQPLMT